MTFLFEFILPYSTQNKEIKWKSSQSNCSSCIIMKILYFEKGVSPLPKNVEIEAKNIVNQEEFENLCNAFSISQSDFQKQINYYFETKNFTLKKNNSALRIREKKDLYKLTLKQPNSVGLLETNQTITKEMAQTMIEQQIVPEGEVKLALSHLLAENEKLELLGTLATYRAKVPYQGGTLVFDKSTYFDVTDYEIEYEGSDEKEVEKHFSYLLSEYHIMKRPTKNKIARFFEYKQKMSQN